MQFKLSVFTLALVALAVATPTPQAGNQPQCDAGSTLLCCNSVVGASSPSVAFILGLLEVDVGSVTGNVGLTCSPITVLNIITVPCIGQFVCCTNNSFNGTVALGCTTPAN